jgi:cell division protein FtsX
MSDRTTPPDQAPWTSLPPQPGTPYPGYVPYPAGPPPVARRRRWVPLVVVAAVATLVGALIATGVVLVLDRDPANRYTVRVFLTQDVTAEQKADVERALAAMSPVDGVSFESREQAYENFKRLYKDNPDIVNSVKPEHMPESFQITTTGKAFSCERLAPLRPLGGIDEIQVIQLPAKRRPGAIIGCG